MSAIPPSAVAPSWAVRLTQERKAETPCRGRVLLVDDDEMLSRFLRRFLQAEGFEVTVAVDGLAAVEALQAELDLVILDLNLPKLDGFGVLQQLRADSPQLPVIVLTARARAESAVLALESGADDCLSKPFSCAELLARLRAQLRRRKSLHNNQSICADLLVHRDELRVERDGKRIDLTPREYNLLEYLMRTPKTPVSRAVLLREVWGMEQGGATNIVDVYMKYVRDKVDLPGMPPLIRTVRGLGYVVSEL